MSRVSTNNIGLRYVIESSLGVAPTTGWRSLEPNDITDFGAEITTVERRPISPNRSERKGTVTNLESSVGFEADLTLDAFTDFAEAFVFAQFANDEFDLKSSAAPPPAVATGDSFTIDAASAQLADKMVYDAAGAITLVKAIGYANAANNGLFPLAADVASTDTAVQVTGSLVDETPPDNASLQVAGVRCAIGDLALTVSGSTATIVSAADITDWSTLGLFVGQFIHVGSKDPSTGGVQNAFDDGAAGDVFGYARITNINGATLTLDKLDVNLDTTDAANATVVDIMFGRFLRNVSVGSTAADGEYLERTFTFEGEYPDLEGVGSAGYEYPEGNYANEWALNLPLTEKATANWGFIGTDTPEITDTRKTGPADAVDPLRTTAINTSSDLAVIATDVVSSQSDVCFQSLTVTLNNNASPQNCLGTLGAAFVNVGLFQVTFEGDMLFTRKEIVNAIRNNQTVTFHTIMKNDDGAIAVDLPAVTLGGGGRSYPVDEAVQVSITGRSFSDPTGVIPNVAIGVSLFAEVPSVRPST
jgi:hypothetical protein